MKSNLRTLRLLFGIYLMGKLLMWASNPNSPEWVPMLMDILFGVSVVVVMLFLLWLAAPNLGGFVDRLIARLSARSSEAPLAPSGDDSPPTNSVSQPSGDEAEYTGGRCF